jgi:SOS-response transcriptional repressor LexA
VRLVNVMVSVILATGFAGSQRVTAADQEPSTPDALRAQIEALRVDTVAWRKVEWRTCLLSALDESAREKKPVFLWVLGGSPANGRC